MEQTDLANSLNVFEKSFKKGKENFKQTSK